jgi:hypothetical protein
LYAHCSRTEFDGFNGVFDLIKNDNHSQKQQVSNKYIHIHIHKNTTMTMITAAPRFKQISMAIYHTTQITTMQKHTVPEKDDLLERRYLLHGRILIWSSTCFVIVGRVILVTQCEVIVSSALYQQRREG